MIRAGLGALGAGLTLAMLSACGGAGVAADEGAATGPAHSPAPGRWAVSGPQKEAVDIAAAVLADGGNAVDAAVAMHFALAVSYPMAGNLGGGGFLVYRAPDGRASFLDFRECAPAAARRDLYLDAEGKLDRRLAQVGWKAAGVPGAVPGMAEAHRRWGTRGWAALVQPAAALARDGYLLDRHEERALEGAKQLLIDDPLAARIFFRGQRPLRSGERLRQPELAATLDAIAARGEAELRDGAIARALVAASQAGGGILTLEDLIAYRPLLRPLHRIQWQGLELLVPTVPSSGAVFLHQVLTVLDERPLAAWGRQDPRAVQYLGEATAAAFRDRNRWLGDPASFDYDPAALLDPSYLAARAAKLSETRHTKPADALPEPPIESAETTHFSIVDAYGGAVSCTTTLNGAYGAKVMAPGGFFLNNEMDDFAAEPGKANQYGLVQGEYNAVRAGHRPLSSMAPVVVVRGGQLEAVLGSPGGPTILTSVLQVLLHRYLWRLDPVEAVTAPRLHRQDQPAVLEYEAGRLSTAAQAALSGYGQPIAERVAPLGHVNAVFLSPGGGGWTAVNDPRRGGAARTGVLTPQAAARR